MKAIILVAGRGSRLPQNISQKPKSLIKINNKKKLINLLFKIKLKILFSKKIILKIKIKLINLR